MEEFKKLVEEGKVSKCGRWLEKPNEIIDYFYIRVKENEIKVECTCRYGGYELFENEIILGVSFYSEAHAELARDTMEAEQICRKDDRSLKDTLINAMVLSGLPRKYRDEELDLATGCCVEKLYTLFGEKRLKEILDQELKEIKG